jgi:hypothetical protein
VARGAERGLQTVDIEDAGGSAEILDASSM